MNLPKPPRDYGQNDQAQTRDLVAREDARNVKKGADLEFNGDAAVAGPRLILVSPNGTRFRLLVSNAGALSTVAV
jgi:hypothetical protein